MISSIHIHVVPPQTMRYDTAGDWQVEDETLQITIADQRNSRYNFALMIHELVEALLCHLEGITTEQVDAFDFAAKTDDPGTEPGCPYSQEHEYAAIIERLVANEMGIHFRRYDEATRSKTYGPAKDTGGSTETWTHFCATKKHHFTTWLDNCPACGLNKRFVHTPKKEKQDAPA